MNEFPHDSPLQNELSQSERKRIAESPSPYSDSLLKVYHPTGAFANIAAYGALLMAQEERWWETDAEVKYFSNLCYRFNYEGKWETFQEILERTQNTQEYEAVCKEIFGTHVYFGNLLPLILKYKRSILVHSRFQRGRVNKPKRKRGYDDHGSLRPNHQKGRNLPGEEKERLDRRTFVAHPLLYGGEISGGVEGPNGPRPSNLTSEVGEEHDLN